MAAWDPLGRVKAEVLRRQQARKDEVNTLLEKYVAPYQRMEAPEMSAPSISAMQRYGYGAMDLASRAAGSQIGAGASQLGGLNPAARAMALAQLVQSGSGMLGQAGLQGYSQGGQLLQGTGQANLQSLLQNRGMGLQASMAGLGFESDLIKMQREYEYQRRLQKQQQDAQSGGFLGGLGSVLGIASSFIPGVGPFGGAVGSLFGGGGGQPASPYQAPYSTWANKINTMYGY